MNDNEMIYKDIEFDIRIYKTKQMDCSRQKMEFNNRLGLLTGISSFLQSCLDTKVMNEKELQEIVAAVLEMRKKGVRNKIIFNNMTEEQ